MVAARLESANRPAAAVAVAVGRLSQHNAGEMTTWCLSQDKVAARLDPANRPAAAVAVAVGRLSQHKAGGMTCWRSQAADEVFEPFNEVLVETIVE